MGVGSGSDHVYHSDHQLHDHEQQAGSFPCYGTNGLVRRRRGQLDSCCSTIRRYTCSLSCRCLPNDQTNATPSNLAISKFTPLWTTQGGLDTWPDPTDAGIVNNNEIAAGSQWTYTFFPTLGHDTWDSCWLEPNFWPFQVNAYSSNPWALHGQFQYCPGVTFSDTLGVSPGFDAYQWRMNGGVLNGKTTNTLVVTQLGTYDCRVERGGIWSDWSHTPAVIATRQPTVTPPITAQGLESFVIPSPSQSNVVLQVPTGYASYTWQKVGSNTTISTTNTLNVPPRRVNILSK